MDFTVLWAPGPNTVFCSCEARHQNWEEKLWGPTRARWLKKTRQAVGKSGTWHVPCKDLGQPLEPSHP